MTKYSIQVKHGEKELYRIFKDLENHGRTTFSYPDRAKRNGISRSIGLKTKPLIERGLFYPPLNSRDSHQVKHPFTGIILPIGVNVKEKKYGNASRFFFQRK